MFAALAVLLALVAGFDGHLGDLDRFDFLAFAIAALAVHHLVGDKIEVFRRRP